MANGSPALQPDLQHKIFNFREAQSASGLSRTNVHHVFCTQIHTILAETLKSTIY